MGSGAGKCVRCPAETESTECGWLWFQFMNMSLFRDWNIAKKASMCAWDLL